MPSRAAPRDLVDPPPRRRVEEALCPGDAAPRERARRSASSAREQPVGVEDPLRQVGNAPAHIPFGIPREISMKVVRGRRPRGGSSLRGPGPLEVPDRLGHDSERRAHHAQLLRSQRPGELFHSKNLFLRGQVTTVEDEDVRRLDLVPEQRALAPGGFSRPAAGRGA